MTGLTTAIVIVAAVGLGVLAYGIRVDEPTIRWGGIAVLAVAWLMRLLRRAPDD